MSITELQCYLANMAVDRIAVLNESAAAGPGRAPDAAGPNYRFLSRCGGNFDTIFGTGHLIKSLIIARVFLRNLLSPHARVVCTHSHLVPGVLGAE